MIFRRRHILFRKFRCCILITQEIRGPAGHFSGPRDVAVCGAGWQLEAHRDRRGG
jgi:hypothetical protein